MRFRGLFHACMVLWLVLYVLYRLSSVFKTLLEDTTPYLLTREELAQNEKASLIPKILHQVYLGWDGKPMPEHWKEPQESCVTLHPDWRYMFWTNDTCYDLLATEYPWFLDIWNSYPYPIQRADSIRYFILEYYGGIYIDLDNGCRRELTPLVAYPAWMPATTNHLGLTQHVMGATPHHPYFRMLIDSLEAYNYNWPMPYMTIMNSAGPHFVSMVWSTYLAKVKKAEVRILPQEEYVGHEWSFFTKVSGGTWYHWDVQFFGWVGHNLVAVIVVCFLSLCVASTAMCWLVFAIIGRFVRQGPSLVHEEDGTSGASLVGFSKID